MIPSVPSISHARTIFDDANNDEDDPTRALRQGPPALAEKKAAAAVRGSPRSSELALFPQGRTAHAVRVFWCCSLLLASSQAQATRNGVTEGGAKRRKKATTGERPPSRGWFATWFALCLPSETTGGKGPATPLFLCLLCPPRAPTAVRISSARGFLKPP